MKLRLTLWSTGAIPVSILLLLILFASHARTNPAEDSSTTRTDANTASVSAAAGDAVSDVARWRNGELVAPLPADPVRRAEAIGLAKEAGRKRVAASGLTPADGVRITQSVIEPQAVDSRPGRRAKRRASQSLVSPHPVLIDPPGERFVPTAEQLQEMAQGHEVVIDPSSMPAVPGPMGGFEAVDYTGWVPPSPDIAVGPEHILVATTDVFAVYDKCGNWIDGGNLGAYFGTSNAYTCYDPRVVYDDWSGRWVMAYIANDFTNDAATIVVALSVSANLEDGWICHYDIGPPVAGDWADNMYMAVDPEGIYLTFNQYSFAGYAFDGPIILALEKEQMYVCAGAMIVTVSGMTNPGDASDAFAVRPAQMHSYPGSMYFLNNKYLGGTLFSFWSLTDPFTAPSVGSAAITTPSYPAPPPMRQPNGTYVKGGDCRISDLVYDDGNLFAVFPTYRDQGGEPYSRITLMRFATSPAAYSSNTSFYTTDYYMSYPSLEIDEYGRLGIAFNRSSYASSAYLGAGYILWDWHAGAFVEAGGVVSGLADFTISGAGTSGNPYRWGNYTGCAVDPVDDRTIWMCAAYASDSPTPSWATHVTAVSAFPESDLWLEPSASYTGGMQGGPFVNDVLPVTLENTGETGLNWQLGNYPYWVTPSAMSGEVPPHASAVVSFFLNEDAYSLPVGVHDGLVEIENCTGGNASCWLRNTVVEPIVCPTSAISLVPPIGDATAAYGAGEYSLFVTAIEDIEVCAMGLMLAHAEPRELTCAVYEADGTTRGALLHTTTEAAVQDMEGTYLISMDMSLDACQEYEIVFTHHALIGHASYSETDFSYPYDVNGLLRVRQSATGGSVGDTQHPGIVVFGHASCDRASGHTCDLYASAAEHTETTPAGSQGLFITARENLYLCSVGFEADLVRDRWLIASVWEATGNTRGALVANGFLPVQAGGLAGHEVPIHAMLRAGQDYNISVAVEETGYWPAVAEGGVSLPYMADDVVEVRKSERDGVASTNLPHIWLNWEDMGTRGAPFDLAKSSDGVPPPYTATGPIDHGAFVEPAATQEVYSLGVRGDIPEGTTITARIYALTVGGLRGPLLTEGSIESAGPGTRWHDVPVALTWTGGARYDLSIVCSNVNGVGYWDATGGMPYAPYGGTIEVQEAETSGSPGGTALIHMRVNACNDVMTSVEDRPPPFTPLSLAAPVPNPANGFVTLRYSVDEPATAALEVYDVAGRRVGTVFTGRHLEAGPGAVDYNAGGLSSGVYFLRLTAGGKAVARKIVVTR